MPEGQSQSPLATASPEVLRAGIETLFADYTGCLNDGRFEEWPDFFTETCLYKIVSRENFERGLPLAQVLCESRGYLQDRVVSIRKTSVYAPRRIRRLTTDIRIVGWVGEALETRASFAVFESLTDEPTRVFMTGEYQDRLVVQGARLLFSERVCIFDGALVQNSLIFPI